MARHWVGTSGWSYANWRNAFYPRGLKQSDWIGFYGERLSSVELNASFYRLPSQSMLEGWTAKTPKRFLFAVKAWRAITHYRRLAECDDLLERFLDAIRPLGAKCGPVLFQTPPDLTRDLALLDSFLALLPKRKRRYAFEFRDPSWRCDAVYERLAARNAAFCVYELGRAHSPRVATADFVYLRLHGPRTRYRGNYSEARLKGWARWLRGEMAEGRDVYAYFDNTDEADHAVRNAMRLDELLSE